MEFVRFGHLASDQVVKIRDFPILDFKHVCHTIEFMSPCHNTKGGRRTAKEDRKEKECETKRAAHLLFVAS